MMPLLGMASVSAIGGRSPVEEGTDADASEEKFVGTGKVLYEVAE
jgi:hypothetical protein